jgi:hypothetical protein
MPDAICRLISLASPPLSADRPGALPPSASSLRAELACLLAQRNGFVAFEGSLRVFPDGSTTAGCDLTSWNAPSLWRTHYDGLADGLTCFAEDIFGMQFALDETAEEIVVFDAETGARDPLAGSLEGWARAVLDEPAVLTGHPLAHEWQTQRGPLPLTHRLVPIVPFVLGGEFITANLYPLEASSGMRLRGDLAVQIRDLPEGTPVRYVVED